MEKNKLISDLKKIEEYSGRTWRRLEKENLTELPKIEETKRSHRILTAIVIVMITISLIYVVTKSYLAQTGFQFTDPILWRLFS